MTSKRPYTVLEDAWIAGRFRRRGTVLDLADAEAKYLPVVRRASFSEAAAQPVLLARESLPDDSYHAGSLEEVEARSAEMTAALDRDAGEERAEEPPPPPKRHRKRRS